ncbi:MAG: MBL fold metallo-hydrolase RNA specificity domain-containing protein [Minisyncoccia bacterium]
MVSIQFCGGAGSVTGANYVIDNGKVKFVIDCGMIQGNKEADELNYVPFVYDPKSIDFMIATHTHIDHIGRIPKLVKEGFRGEIYSTYPTEEFAEISLRDTVSIMEHDKTQIPLFGSEDVDQAVSQWRGIEYHEIYEMNENISFRFQDAGHILGSAITEIWVLDPETGKRIKLVFSGDLGNVPSVLLRKYDYISEADYIIVESCYGDRIHQKLAERKEILKQAIKDTIERKSVLLMPTFSIERTQDILYELNDIIENHSGNDSQRGKVGKIDVYLDSPLAIKATNIHAKYTQYYNQEAKQLSKTDDIFDFPFLTFTESREDSMKVNSQPQPKMIMAGSGMSTGGRVLYHEERYLSNPNNIILFVGYQAPYTLGRKILKGESPVYIHNHPVENKIEVRRIDGYSAHADQEMLLDWISKIKNSKNIFVVQGEQDASQTLADAIKDNLHIQAQVPTENEIVMLS